MIDKDAGCVDDLEDLESKDLYDIITDIIFANPQETDAPGNFVGIIKRYSLTELVRAIGITRMPTTRLISQCKKRLSDWKGREMFERVMVENYGFEFRRNGGDNTLSQHLKFNEMLEDGLRVTGEELYGLEDLRSDSYCDISQFEVRYMFQHYNGFKWPDKNMELEIFCQSLVHDLSKSQELSEEGTRLRYGNIESALNSILISDFDKLCSGWHTIQEKLSHPCMFARHAET
jgi:hypothetical protein